MLKPQDILVAVKLALLNHGDWSVRDLADQLCMSATEIHNSTKRLVKCRLMLKKEKMVIKNNLIDFLSNGIKYVFPAIINDNQVYGTPTATSAGPLSEELDEQYTYVWKSTSGNAHGYSIDPLYKSVVAACHKDPKLYRCMTIVDCLRLGNPSSSYLARSYINQFLS